jgi:hypothetical protein
MEFGEEEREALTAPGDRAAPTLLSELGLLLLRLGAAAFGGLFTAVLTVWALPGL